MRRLKTNFGEADISAVWLNPSAYFHLFFAFLIFFCSPAATKAEKIDFSAQPVVFGADGMSDRIGKLEILSAHVLNSEDSRFGGFSGLRFLQNGRKMISVSDKGRALILSVDRASNGAISKLRIDDFFALRDRRLAKLSRKTFHGDAESLAFGPGKSFLVGFEGRDRILQFKKGILSGPGRLFLPLKNIPNMGLNRGLETLLKLPSGGHLAIAEQFNRRHNGYRGFRLKAGKLTGFTYRTAERYRPVDGMALKNGDLLILERLFNPPFYISSRIVRISRSTVLKQDLKGREVARWDADRIGDNFEGLAVVEWKGRTLVHVISDDNFNFYQGTYLITFLLTQ